MAKAKLTVTITNDQGKVLSRHLVTAVDSSLDEEDVEIIIADALPSTLQVEVEELTTEPA